MPLVPTTYFTDYTHLVPTTDFTDYPHILYRLPLLPRAAFTAYRCSPLLYAASCRLYLLPLSASTAFRFQRLLLADCTAQRFFPRTAFTVVTRFYITPQILTASMLDVSGAVLDLHTGDDRYDYLTANAAACPRLTELSDVALTSPEWQDR